ncbi:SnoaL-like domain-containing protein [Nannocystis exedens]|uniref:SnoaL-like domain-containing protein n=1 Tax=Nannocystis exedens TaxID=54 RepID=A0A1I2GU14_9BACT|nr:nuclear transport factor 2 family protein [Nannocystis exedens]PCC68792.1 SnoaL-like domain protein [Nannocystis exedens]SFF20116.1 SnoaL-like domain-containing protein [Nannocystis exedens]
MSVAMPAAQNTVPSLSLPDLFARYHVGWETRDPSRIASLHSEDSVFHVHDGSEPVHGRDALRRHCAELFSRFDWSFEMGRRFYGADHWVFEWTMVLALREPGGAPFTARVEMLDVVTLNRAGEVARKDVFTNGAQAQAAFARAGIAR